MIYKDYMRIIFDYSLLTTSEDVIFEVLAAFFRCPKLQME